MSDAGDRPRHGDSQGWPLVGLIEIAQAAGVRRPVVSMWRTRYADFPLPVQELAVGPVFWWPDIEEWLRLTGRRVDANWSRDAIRSSWESQATRTTVRKWTERLGVPPESKSEE